MERGSKPGNLRVLYQTSSSPPTKFTAQHCCLTAGLPEDAGRASSPAASQIQVSTGSLRQQLIPTTCQPWRNQLRRDGTGEGEGETWGEARVAATSWWDAQFGQVACKSGMKGQAYLQSTEQLTEAGNGLEDLLRENRSIAIRSHWVPGYA